VAGDWIPSPIDEPRSRPILAVARRTGRSRHEVFGLWTDFKGWASRETVDGLLGRLTLGDLREIIGGDEKFWAAIVAEGLLEIHSEDLFIPNASEWLATGVKARQKRNMRQQRWREGKKRSHATPPARFLSVKAAAMYTELSEDSIRRMLERGALTAFRPVKGKILIDRQQLDSTILGSSSRPRSGRGLHRRAERGQQ